MNNIFFYKNKILKNKEYIEPENYLKKQKQKENFSHRLRNIRL